MPAPWNYPFSISGLDYTFLCPIENGDLSSWPKITPYLPTSVQNTQYDLCVKLSLVCQTQLIPSLLLYFFPAEKFFKLQITIKSLFTTLHHVWMLSILSHWLYWKLQRKTKHRKAEKSMWPSETLIFILTFHN